MTAVIELGHDMLQEVRQKLGLAVGAGLFKDALKMIIDRARAELEMCSDLFKMDDLVSKKCEHFFLTRT